MRGGDDTGEEHKEGTRSGAGEGGRPGIESRSPRARAWRGTARRVQLGRWAAEEAMPVGPGGVWDARDAPAPGANGSRGQLASAALSTEGGRRGLTPLQEKEHPVGEALS
jgi:hypothetical protein